MRLLIERLIREAEEALEIADEKELDELLDWLEYLESELDLFTFWKD